MCWNPSIFHAIWEYWNVPEEMLLLETQLEGARLKNIHLDLHFQFQSSAVQTFHLNHMADTGKSDS